MAEWWSIEVFSGDRLPAGGWRYAYEDELTEAAITHGALYYEWHDTRYGVIFEILFARDEQWDAFRWLSAVQAALDGVPDPVNGLLVYRGRGGAAGGRQPRKPRPAPGAAALELEEPRQEQRIGQVRVPRTLSDNGGSTDDELRRELGVEEPPGVPLPDVGGPGTYGPELTGPEPGAVSGDIAVFDGFDGQVATRLRCLKGEPRPWTVQDGEMTETRVMTEDLKAAVERSGYYPGLVTDAVASALGSEPVTAFFVHHDAIFDPGMEVRRHMTVLALTPSRLVYSHTDEHPADEPESRPRAETSSESVRFSRVTSVSLTRVVPDPASYKPGVTMPSEVILTIGWNVLSHVELEPAHCGDESCEADHGYLGTITADDLTLRISEAADGEDAVRQVLAFASALNDATAGAGS